MDASFTALAQNPALLRAALAFNGAYDAPLGVPAALAKSPRWRRRPHGRDEAATGVWDFGREVHRLALLPPATLDELCARWSAAVLGDDLAKIVDGRELRRVTAVIGGDMYRYAVRRGRFQLGGQRARLLPPATPRAPWTAERLRRPGQILKSLVFAAWPAELRRVWLARAAQDAPAAPPAGAATVDGLWTWLKKILLTEVAPEWQPCFDS
jgi:hypothetical protein